MDNIETEFEILNKKGEMLDLLSNGSLEDLKQYFIKSEVTNNSIYSDLQMNINHAFKIAVNCGYIEKVKYLLTSSDLDIHANIHFDNDFAIRASCEWGYKHIVEYLLDSPELKEHAKLPQDIDFVFESIGVLIKEARSELECEEYLDFLTYLIYEKEILPTKKIESILKRFTPIEFEKNALAKLTANELEYFLPRENINQIKKIKI
jgi:hypothetical protein